MTRIRNIVHLLGRVRPFGFKRILLLEDDRSMHRLVEKVLAPLHARVEHFGTGRDVVARVATDGKRYDALLLDLMMPHDGGLTVLRELQQHQPALLERVILLTGSARAATDPWAGLVFAIVRKPFDSPALMATVQACIERGRAERKTA
jgi:two-component system OmpR family response regulator